MLKIVNKDGNIDKSVLKLVRINQALWKQIKENNASIDWIHIPVPIRLSFNRGKMSILVEQLIEKQTDVSI
jgi:hypothetical protein